MAIAVTTGNISVAANTRGTIRYAWTLHGAELGRDVGADPAGEGHAGQHRAQLHHHGLRDQGAHEVERDRAGEDVRGEEREDDPGEDGEEQRDRDRVHPEPPHLGHQVRSPGPREPERPGGIARPPAGPADEAQLDDAEDVLVPAHAA
jgi:hypothetical protein